jgi:hypothetical protein
MHGDMRYYASGRKKKYNAWSTKKVKVEKEFKPLSWNPPVRETREVKSLDTGVGVAPKVESTRYTGTLVKGIATMHKSNAVPVINQEEATDISKMRRG